LDATDVVEDDCCTLIYIISLLLWAGVSSAVQNMLRGGGKIERKVSVTSDQFFMALESMKEAPVNQVPTVHIAFHWPGFQKHKAAILVTHQLL
jgi:hypothetical protein